MGETQRNFAEENIKQILQLPIDNIKINEHNPRKNIKKEPLEELSRSIKAVGVLQPIQVRRVSATEYVLTAGERRLRAAKMAGLKFIPAVISAIKDEEYAIITLIENLQRENLNYFEEATAYNFLMRNANLTQEQLAHWVGKSQSTIANKIRLLKLSQPIKELLIDYNLSERHARILLRINDEQLRQKVLAKICQNNLSVREAEVLINKVVLKTLEGGANQPQRTKVRRAIKDIRIFVNTIKNAVELMKNSGIDARATRADRGEFIEIIVRIPKKVTEQNKN